MIQKMVSSEICGKFMRSAPNVTARYLLIKSKMVSIDFFFMVTFLSALHNNQIPFWGGEIIKPI